MNWSARNLKVNWHPYTQMKDCENDPPVVIEKALGLKLIDETNITITTRYQLVVQHTRSYAIQELPKPLINN